MPLNSKKILLEARRVNIGQIIATEIKNVAENAPQYNNFQERLFTLLFPRVTPSASASSMVE
ncbi:hypothetical protein RYX36_037331 [Vicia faba]